MKKIKTGDTVKIITGKYKGLTGTVQECFKDSVLVSGINIKKRATKGKWFVEKIHPIHISNIAYYDIEDQKKSKICIITNSDWLLKRKIVNTNRILSK